MAMSAEHMSKFAALHWQWWRLQMSEISRVVRKTPNKQTNITDTNITNKVNRRGGVEVERSPRMR